LFALWIYATPAITKYIFTTTDTGSYAFEKGIKWVGYCFAFYSLIAAFLSFFIPILTNKIGILKVHAYALLFAAIGLMAIYFVHNKWMLLIPFTCIGIGWSSISNVPYKIVANVSGEKEMDFYMSIFSFSVVIPQIVAATMLQVITTNFLKGNTAYTIICGGVSMLIAAVIMWLIGISRKSVI